MPYAQLDRWAEHLTWCYRMLGVRDGASIGVVDFGVSPVGFLGSRFLTPGLEQGVAERLAGTTICLDASWERVTLVPSVLGQFPINVLVVRNEVRPLLETTCRDAGVELERLLLIDVVGLSPRAWGAASPAWKRLLVIEAAMLMAPQCDGCGAMHLAASRYDVDPETRTVTAVALSLTQAVPAGFVLEEPGCELGPADWLLRKAGEEVVA